MATIIAAIQVCMDCLLLHANGEFSPGRPESLPEPLSLITAGYTVTLGGEHTEHCGGPDDCECDDLGFRQSRCEGCGDWHHGDRFAMTLWKE